MDKPKNNIGWSNITTNPVQGLCPFKCEISNNCYAHQNYKRWKRDPSLKLRLDQFQKLNNILPSRVFLGSTMELFHRSIHGNWLKQIFSKIEEYPQHTFILLTKCPKRAIRWTYPENMIIGVSVTSKKYFWRIKTLLNSNIIRKMISFEPLIGDPFPLSESLNGIDWIIIGALTHAGKPIEKKYPQKEWISKIEQEAKKHNIPLWEKENLIHQRKLIQEIPENIPIDTMYEFDSIQEFYQWQERGLL